MPKEDPVEQWTAELQQNGRVVLRVRRGKIAFVAFIAAIGIVNGVNVGQELLADTWSAYDYVRTAIAVFAAVHVLSSLDNMRGGRSRVTVDDGGVSIGRSRLAWSEIDRVDVQDDAVTLHSGLPGEQTLTVRDLVLRHPKDFAAWLDTELRTRVRPASLDAAE
ncbi:hypothetical protein [Kribbella catacumbae]|uniref:hypothetical protein n=1 Tax=Kribbella catacumbae TaxID=460086 RepID=UPI0003643EC2|nr:hypothetical protein [Kribbella catacumbae]